MANLGKSLTADLAPVAARVAALLALPEDEQAEAARSLMEDLPGLVPADPEMAAVLEEAIAETFAAAAGDNAGVENENPNKTPDGRFALEGTGDLTGGGGGEESGYSDANRGQVGKSGDWKKLGLPAGRDIPAAEPTPKTKIAAARARLEKGETVKSPLGDTLAFDGVTRRHLYQKGRSQKEIEDRLQRLDQAHAAASAPHEIWRDEPNSRNIYVRFERDDQGKAVINAVDTSGGSVYSWHANTTSYDHYRKGKLLYVRK